MRGQTGRVGGEPHPRIAGNGGPWCRLRSEATEAVACPAISNLRAPFVVESGAVSDCNRYQPAELRALVLRHLDSGAAAQQMIDAVEAYRQNTDGCAGPAVLGSPTSDRNLEVARRSR